MADLLTLAEYRLLVGIDPTDTRDDPRVSALLPMVTRSILTFTERDFGTTPVIETRTFEYDGSGFLDIDDAATVAAVRVVYPGGQTITLPTTDWTAKPQRRDDAEVYYYIDLPSYGFGNYGSPEMGFTRNLDVWAREHGGFGAVTVEVDGTWGWTVVPSDVKLAAAWTLQDWMSRSASSSESLTSEAIEGYSRSWGGRGSAAVAAMAIPNRARDILAMYMKQNT